MNHLLAQFHETVVSSANTAAKAADDYNRRNGMLEEPDAHACRASVLRERLQTLHSTVGTTASRTSPEEITEMISIVQEILGGVWNSFRNEIYDASLSAGCDIYAQRHLYIQTGIGWVWNILGRSLGTPRSSDF